MDSRYPTAQDCPLDGFQQERSARHAGGGTRDFGAALYEVQAGHGRRTPFIEGLHGRYQLVEHFDGRPIVRYTTVFDGVVYVLDVFEKSTAGRATPRPVVAQCLRFKASTTAITTGGPMSTG
jgi:phage-related protein